MILPPEGEGLRKGVSFQCFKYCLQDHFAPIHHFIIPEPEDSKALVFKPKSPLLIIFSSRGVLSSINLNDETPLVAKEVDDIRAD